MSMIAVALVTALNVMPQGQAGPGSQVTTNGQTEAEVAAVLDRLNVASTAADGPAYFALFAPDARFVGTDASEHWSLSQFRAFAEPYFAQGKGWSYPATERTITIASIDCRCLAWFEEKLTNTSYGETRGSGVLRLIEGQWKIEQYVLSFVVPNDASKAVVDAIAAQKASAAPVRSTSGQDD